MALGVGKFFGAAKRPLVKLALLAEPRSSVPHPAADILHRYLGAEDAAKKGEPFAKLVTQETLVDGWPIELTLIDGLEGGDETKKLWPLQDAFLVLWFAVEPTTYGTAVRNAQLARDKGRKEVPIILAQIDAHLRDAKAKPPDIAGLLRDKKLALTAYDGTVDTKDGLHALIAEGARQALAAKNSDFRALLKTVSTPTKGALELKKRSLHALPASFASLAPTLERLDISNNELGALPTEILLCTALRELKANAIGVTTLPEELPVRLPRLQVLHLESNALEALPLELAEMKDLKEVRLKGNPLPGYPKDVFASTALLVQHLRVLKSASSSGPARKGAGVHVTFHVLCLRNLSPLSEALCRITVLKDGEQLGQELHTGASLAGTAPLWNQAFTLTALPLDSKLRFEAFAVRDGALSGMLGDSIGVAEATLSDLVKDPDAQRSLALLRNGASTACLLDVRFVLAGEGVSRPQQSASPPNAASATASPAPTRDRDSKRKGDTKEEQNNGVFGVPLETLLERDRKVWGASQRCPRLVEQAVEHLILHGLSLEGLFRIAGVQEEMKALRQGWNLGALNDFKNESSAHNVAGMLKAFLRELPIPLLSFEIGPELLRAADVHEEAAQVAALKAALDKLPAANKAVLQLLIPFLAMVTDNAQVNRMHFANVAKVLGPNLYWSKEASAFDLTAIDKANDLTTFLIQYSPQLFEIDPTDEVRPLLRHRLAAHRSPLTALAIAEGDTASAVWTGDASGAIKRWEAEQCRPDTGGAQVEGKVNSLLFVPPSRLFVAHSKGLQARSTATDALPVEQSWTDECYSLARSDTHLYAGSAYKILFVTLTALDKPIQSVSMPAPKDTETTSRPHVTALAYSAHSAQLWAAAERQVTVFTKNGSVASSWLVTGNISSIAAIGESVWIATDDRLVLVYAASTGFTMLRVLDAHPSRLSALISLGAHVWGVSPQGAVHAWNSSNYASLGQWTTRALEPVSIGALRYNRTYEQWQVWIASADRFVNVWNAPTAVIAPSVPVIAPSAATTATTATAQPPPIATSSMPNVTVTGSTPRTNGTPRAEMVRQRRRPQLIVVEDESAMPAPQRATVARSSLGGSVILPASVTTAPVLASSSNSSANSASPASSSPLRSSSPSSSSTPAPPHSTDASPTAPRLRQRTASRAQLVEDDAAPAPLPMRAYVLRASSAASGLHVMSASEEAAEVKAQHERVRAALAERQLAPDEREAERLKAEKEQAEKKKVDNTLAKLAKFGLAPSTDSSPASSPIRSTSRTSLIGISSVPSSPSSSSVDPVPTATDYTPSQHPSSSSTTDAPPSTDALSTSAQSTSAVLPSSPHVDASSSLRSSSSSIPLPSDSTSHPPNDSSNPLPSLDTSSTTAPPPTDASPSSEPLAVPQHEPSSSEASSAAPTDAAAPPVASSAASSSPEEITQHAAESSSAPEAPLQALLEASEAATEGGQKSDDATTSASATEKAPTASGASDAPSPEVASGGASAENAQEGSAVQNSAEAQRVMP